MAQVYKRGTTWWVRFRIDGRHVRRSAKTSRKAEATEFLHKLMREHASIARGDLPRRTYEQGAERFFIEASISSKTKEGYRTSYRALLPIFNGVYFDQITRQRIGEFVSIRKHQGVSDTSVLRDLAFFSSLCSMAMRWGWLEVNPIRAYDKRTLKQSKPRTRFLTDDEYHQLLNEASPHVRDAIMLAVETGLRREEQFSLQWCQIDWDRNEIILERTKTDTPRRVPLSPIAKNLLWSHWIRVDQNVSIFVHEKLDNSRYVDMHRGFLNACRRADITNMRWHDLRHTYASWFVQNGGELYQLSRILGHTTLAMTARYGHLRTEDLHAAVRKVTQNRSQRTSATVRAVYKFDHHVE
ncbi:MAG: site-specific integrase [Rhodobacteraceae bacterium]|nr:site-specific integrase [Paracoccaceae bacterium]